MSKKPERGKNRAFTMPRPNRPVHSEKLFAWSNGNSSIFLWDGGESQSPTVCDHLKLQSSDTSHAENLRHPLLSKAVVKLKWLT
jgi:hypothetical protein